LRESGTMARSSKADQGLAVMAIGGLVIAGALLMLVWRFGERIDAGVVARCQITQGARQRLYAVVTTEDGREVWLYDELPKRGHCLATGTRIEKRRDELDFRLNERPVHWSGRYGVPAIVGLGALIALIGAGVWATQRRRARALAPQAASAVSEPAPAAAREIRAASDPARAWLPRRVRIALWVPASAVLASCAAAIAYSLGELDSALLGWALAAIAAFLAFDGPTRTMRALIRLERRLALAAARRRAAHDPRVVRLHGRLNAVTTVPAVLGSEVGAYRQLAITFGGRDGRVLLESTGELELLHAHGRTALDARRARLLCKPPRERALAGAPAAELAALLRQLRLPITAARAGETLLRSGDEVEVIGFKTDEPRASRPELAPALGSAGDLPLLIISTRSRTR